MRKLLTLAALAALAFPLAACRDRAADAGAPASAPTVTSSSSAVQDNTPYGCETSTPRCK
jgi:uncharacterized lipoprotein YbaY